MSLPFIMSQAMIKKVVTKQCDYMFFIEVIFS